METNQSEASNEIQKLSQALAGAVEKASAVVVAVDARPRVPTSGVLWREGVVVSTSHTVRRDEEITVTLPDGKNVAATLAGRDPGTDLAVLRLEGAGSEVAQVGDAATLKVGHLVLAVGRARGVSASLGIVSARGGAWRTWRGGEIDHLIRLDLAIQLGFSGGALVDLEGRVLGINTSGLARGAGLSLPASTVNRVVDVLLERGSVARGYLGVGMHPVAITDALRSKLNLSQEAGVIVLSMEPDGPAESAGLLIGDVLFALNGARVSSTDDVQAALGASGAGQTITASIIRGGATSDINVTLGERPRRRHR